MVEVGKSYKDLWNVGNVWKLENNQNILLGKSVGKDCKLLMENGKWLWKRRRG